MKDKNPKFILLSEAAKNSPYSQDYLSLLARRGKLFAKKIGRNWYTTEKAIQEYLNAQGLSFVIPKDVISPSYKGKFKNPFVITTADEKENKVVDDEEKEENLRIKIYDLKPLEDKLEQIKLTIQQNEVPNELRIAKDIKDIKDTSSEFTKKEKEFVHQFSKSRAYGFWNFNKRASELLKTPGKALVVIVSAITLLFIVVGGFALGNVDNISRQVNKVIKDAETIQGHFAGTHANEVLVLDQAGNISIFGHIETQGQLKSSAPDGVPPLVINSSTLIENLNAEYWNGKDVSEFESLASIASQTVIDIRTLREKIAQLKPGAVTISEIIELTEIQDITQITEFISSEDLLRINTELKELEERLSLIPPPLQISGGGNTTIIQTLNPDEINTKLLTVDAVKIDGNSITTTEGNLTIGSAGGTINISGDINISGSHMVIG